MYWDHMGGVFRVLPDNPMLDLPMGHQGPCRQVRIALGAAEQLAEYLLVKETLSFNPEDLGLCGVSPYHAKGLARHTHLISHVGAQPKPINQIYKDVEQPLYPGRPR